MAYTIADLFEHAADLHGERTALLCDGQSRTYAELDAESNRVAHYLRTKGVRAGDHVGVYCRNSIECLAAMLAIYKIRAVAININYRYAAGEVAYLLDNCDAVALFTEAQYLPTLGQVASGGGVVPPTIVWGEGGAQPRDFACVPYQTALEDGAPARLDITRHDDDRYIVYTGGTTGMPKGVIWRQEDIFRVMGGGIDAYTGAYVTDEFELARRGRHSIPSVTMPIPPMIHAASQFGALRALFAGDAVVLAPTFDPAQAWQLIERHRVTMVLIAGDAIGRPLIETLQSRPTDSSSVAVVVSTAALFSASVKRQFLDALPHAVIVDSIGSSETGFTGMAVVGRDDHQQGGPRVEIPEHSRVLDDDGRPVAPGAIGRLARWGHVPVGYHKDPEKTAATFVTIDGVRYALPGDLARVELDGTITMLGRGARCINSGGEKIFPEEVEGALKAHPAVLDALVVGIPDDRLGHRVGALVQCRDGHHVTLDDLAEATRDSLGRYKSPRSLWLVTAIRRSPAGKPDYRWAQQHTTSIAPTEERRARAGTVKI